MFGLLSKSLKAASALRLRDQRGCFGKMPIHPDFIRHGVRAREVLNLENWVQEGIGLLSRRALCAGHESLASFPCHHLVMNGGVQDRTLVGTLSASRDRGSRAYPFVVFSLADEPLFRDMQAAVPLAFDEFFQRSAEILAAPWRQEPVSLLFDRIDGIPSRDTGLSRRGFLERQIELLGEIPMGRFWNEVFGGCVLVRQGLFEVLFSALRSAVRKGPGRVTWGLRLPLGRGDILLPTVVFWVQMIEAILEEPHWRAHYFWHEGDNELPASLTLFFRPLAASLFLWLMPVTADEAGLLDVRRAMTQRSDVKCSPELVRIINDNEVSMLDFLYRAGRREVLS
jgi:type VI secretion system protein ImpM